MLFLQSIFFTQVYFLCVYTINFNFSYWISCINGYKLLPLPFFATASLFSTCITKKFISCFFLKKKNLRAILYTCLVDHQSMDFKNIVDNAIYSNHLLRHNQLLFHSISFLFSSTSIIFSNFFLSMSFVSVQFLSHLSTLFQSKLLYFNHVCMSDSMDKKCKQSVH